MKSNGAKRLLRVAIVLAGVPALSIAGLSAWVYWHAERRPDVVGFQLFVLYDCARHGVAKGDRRFVRPDRALEGCGVPDTALKFFDGRGRLLLAGVTDRRGEYRFFRNTIVGDPVADIRRVAIETPRCAPGDYSVALESRHVFQGEYMASRGWRYSGRVKVFCDYLGIAREK